MLRGNLGTVRSSQKAIYYPFHARNKLSLYHAIGCKLTILFTKNIQIATEKHNSNRKSNSKTLFLKVSHQTQERSTVLATHILSLMMICSQFLQIFGDFTNCDKYSPL